MKTEVYSWRLSPQLKSELEEAARLITKARQAVEDDRAWEAATPKQLEAS